MILRLLRWTLTVSLVAIAVPLTVWLSLPWPWALRFDNPPATAFMRYRDREARRAGQEFHRVQEWVPLEEMPEHLVRAVLVAEDDRFREHGGVDWKALAEEVHWKGGETFSWWSAEDRGALWAAVGYARANWSEIRGRSTITQQLAKNLYFTPERSLLRKAGEFVVARRLELFLEKDRILELYLNTVELGPGVFGVGAASRAYFDTPVQRIDRFQAASLAATLPHPLTSNPSHRPSRMAWRRDLILGRLAGRDLVIPPAPLPPASPELELPPPDVDVGPSLDSVPASSERAAQPDTVPGGGGPPAPDTVRTPSGG